MLIFYSSKQFYWKTLKSRHISLELQYMRKVGISYSKKNENKKKIWKKALTHYVYNVVYLCVNSRSNFAFCFVQQRYSIDNIFLFYFLLYLLIYSWEFPTKCFVKECYQYKVHTHTHARKNNFFYFTFPTNVLI